jgi:hypothetical protein
VLKITQKDDFVIISLNEQKFLIQLYIYFRNTVQICSKQVVRSCDPSLVYNLNLNL